jgi:hypothetical protein
MGRNGHPVWLTVRWVLGLWPHLIALPVMFFVFTALHESAHALAVIVQGGEIIEFSIIPTADVYGYIQYRFPEHSTASSWFVSVSPYLMWLGVMVATSALAFVRLWNWWFGSTMFLWGYLCPWLDIYLHWCRFQAGVRGPLSDFSHAFGEPAAWGWVLLAVMATSVAVWGYYLHRRLYHDRYLSVPGYVALVILTGGAILAGFG